MKELNNAWPNFLDTPFLDNNPKLFIKKLREQGIDEGSINKVLTVLDRICTYCFNDNKSTCTCMRDR